MPFAKSSVSLSLARIDVPSMQTPLTKRRRSPSLSTTCRHQSLFFHLSNHMTGENGPFNSRRDLRMTSYKGDSKPLAGLVNLMEDFFDEIDIGLLFREEERR